MRKLVASFSRSLLKTTAFVFIGVSCFSSLAFTMKPDDGVTETHNSLKRKNPEDENPSKRIKLSYDLGDLSDFPIIAVIDHILGFLDHKSLIYMGGTNKSFHKICHTPVLWEVLFKRDLYGSPSLSLSTLQLKSPSHYYGLAYCFQERLLPEAIREGKKFTISEGGEWEGMASKAFPENSAQGNYILGLVNEFGLVNEVDNLEEKAFEFYLKAADRGHVKAQKIVSWALYEGALGQEALSKEEAFEELKTREVQGDRYAQKWVNEALYWGKLGQKARPEAERFEELKIREAQGDRYAQKRLNKALLYGKLGLSIFSVAQRRAWLWERAFKGDRSAQKLFSDAVIWGYLDFDQVPDEKRIKLLKKCAARGDKYAQKDLCLSLYHGDFFDEEKEPPAEERFAELEAYAALGYQDAQKWVNRFLRDGIGVGIRETYEECRQEGLKKLKARADLGDLSAQFHINNNLYIVGPYNQDPRPQEERLEEIIPNIKRDLDAGLVAGKHETINNSEFTDMYTPTCVDFIFPVLHSLREGK